MPRPSPPWVALCLALRALALTSLPAAAATMTVTTEDDELAVNNGRCALREAIVNANANNQSGSTDCPAGSGADTITLPGGTFRLSIGGSGATLGDLDLTSPITITGAGPGKSIIDATALNDRVFDIGSGATVTIAGVTIQHGHTPADGGGVRNNGTLTLRDVVVLENEADEDGGGVYNEDGRTLTMIRTSIRDNTSHQDGGGLFNDGGTVEMTDGAISGNEADEDAGGVRNEPGGDMTLTRVQIIGNETHQDAGGVRNDGTMTMDRVTVGSNIAADTSGGIENRGTLDIVESTVDGNRANGGDGGGIQNQDGATLTIVRSAIVNNVSSEDGGGIDLDDGTAELTNVTISGNTAAVDGGGLEASDNADVMLLHVTIANNTAAQGNGIFNDGGAPGPATITLRSSIIANGPARPNCAGAPVTSDGFNLEFPGNSCGLGAGGDITGLDPKLGPLANNGGPTPTHALTPASPAIDAATNAGCPGTDQRNETRPVDGNQDGVSRCDIGAFEFQIAVAQAESKPNENDEDAPKKETEEQRQQRERTNRSNRSDYKTEGNVLAVERGPGGATLLVTIGVTRGETLIVQVTCVDLRCPDIRIGDYLEADGYQNGVGDPNAYFIADDVTVLRGGKKVK